MVKEHYRPKDWKIEGKEIEIKVLYISHL